VVGDSSTNSSSGHTTAALVFGNGIVGSVSQLVNYCISAVGNSGHISTSQCYSYMANGHSTLGHVMLLLVVVVVVVVILVLLPVDHLDHSFHCSVLMPTQPCSSGPCGHGSMSVTLTVSVKINL